MVNQFDVKKNVVINASISEVWDSLVNPEMIKKYLFGTNAVSDWKKGSDLLFKGEWEGKPYEDKAKILEIKKDKVLKYSYYSEFSGLPDSPENYNIITMELFPEGNKTKLLLSQENNRSKESQEHSEKNWGMVLDNLKMILE
jgi:uncharacterized protein YndB with AHSA1/START domain